MSTESPVPGRRAALLYCQKRDRDHGLQNRTSASLPAMQADATEKLAGVLYD